MLRIRRSGGRPSAGEASAARAARVAGRDGEIGGARRCTLQQAERRAGPRGLLQPCLAKAQPRLRYAAEAALAAQAQDKFWQMHDKLFENFRSLSREHMLAWAQEIGLDMPRFTADLDSGRFKKTIERDIADGDTAGVEGTPTFFINGKRYNGRLDLGSLKPILDAELKK